VFVRREILQQVGGWDPDCLAEDCELGVRLSVRGAKVAVAYEAELVTKEETPESVGALFRQRTRWHQGFLQVLRKGVWRKLPSLRQRILACYTLMMPILQTWVVASIPLSLLLACFVDLPVGVAMLAFVPLLPLMATAAVQTIGLGEFGRTYGPRARVRDYAGLLLGMWPYQLILGAAAIRATRRELRGVNTWEKTEHVGAHRPHRTYGEVVV
jgi:cellulose synthase/poly-beta-1,6-N-acetylglucosamine synthase-like glycosyltransferase